ncbi:hypothetical protein [Spirosoma aerophilum]
MKKHTEKQPIDELFARRLGNMSMKPSADGFERLQARMGKNKPEAKIVFWQNPVMQRYMAAAACLLLVSLFGWLYWPSNDAANPGQNQVAVNRSGPSVATAEKTNEKHDVQPVKPNGTPALETETPTIDTTPADQMAVVNNSVEKSIKTETRPGGQVERSKTLNMQPAMPATPMVAQTKPVEPKAQDEAVAPVAPVNQTKAVTEQLADNRPVTKPTPAAERVLEVTIAEPEALVAARQAAKTAIETKAMVAQTEKSEKETKTGSLWQQVKRIKSGEVFARQDKLTDEEGGLLGRAYSGIKHSLEKDKSDK